MLGHPRLWRGTVWDRRDTYRPPTLSGRVHRWYSFHPGPSHYLSF